MLSNTNMSIKHYPSLAAAQDLIFTELMNPSPSVKTETSSFTTNVHETIVDNWKNQMYGDHGIPGTTRRYTIQSNNITIHSGIMNSRMNISSEEGLRKFLNIYIK